MNIRENYRKSRGRHGRIIGNQRNIWEKHRKLHGKRWENHGDMRISMENNMGEIMRILGNIWKYGKSSINQRENMEKYRKIHELNRFLTGTNHRLPEGS